MNTIARAWKRYNQLLIERPLLSKGLTGGTLFALGDFMAQHLDGTMISPEGYNAKRTAIGFCWSSCIFTPHGHQWYARFLPRLFPTPRLKHSMGKMILDQTIFATYINTLYLSYSTLAHGGSLDDAKKKVEKDLWTVLKANYWVWPATQLAAFTFIPIPLQMPVMNIVVMFWSCYMSLVGNRERVEMLKLGIVPDPDYEGPLSVVQYQNHVMGSVFEDPFHTPIFQTGQDSPTVFQDPQAAFKAQQPTQSSPLGPSLIFPTAKHRILASLDDPTGNPFSPRRTNAATKARPISKSSSPPSPPSTPPPPDPTTSTPTPTPTPTPPTSLSWLRSLQSNIKSILPDSILLDLEQREIQNLPSTATPEHDQRSLDLHIKRLYEPSPSSPPPTAPTTTSTPTPSTSQTSEPKSFLPSLNFNSNLLYAPIIGLYQSLAYVTNTYDAHLAKKDAIRRKEEEVLHASVVILDALEGIFTDETIRILDTLEYTKFLEMDQIIFLNNAKTDFLKAQHQQAQLDAKKAQQDMQERMILNQLSEVGVRNVDDDKARLELYHKYPFLLANAPSNLFSHTSGPSGGSDVGNKNPFHIHEANLAKNSGKVVNGEYPVDHDYIEYTGGASGSSATKNNQKSFQLVNPNKLSPNLLSTMSDTELLSVLFDNDVPKDRTTVKGPAGGRLAAGGNKVAMEPEFMSINEIKQVALEDGFDLGFSSNPSSARISNTRIATSPTPSTTPSNRPPTPSTRPQYDHDDYDERGNPVSPAVTFGFSREERENDEVIKSFFEPYSPPDSVLADGAIMISLEDDDMQVLRKGKKGKNDGKSGKQPKGNLWVTDRDVPDEYLDKQKDQDDDDALWDDDDETDMLELYIDYNKEIHLAKKIKAEQRQERKEQRQLGKTKKTNAGGNKGLIESVSYGQVEADDYRGYQDEDGVVYDMTFFDDVDDSNDFVLHAHQPSSTKRKKGKKGKSTKASKSTDSASADSSTPSTKPSTTLSSTAMPSVYSLPPSLAAINFTPEAGDLAFMPKIDTNELRQTGLAFTQAYSISAPTPSSPRQTPPQSPQASQFDLDAVFQRHDDDDSSPSGDDDDDGFRRDILRERAVNKRLFK